MWDYCGHSLDIARLRGATYADVRVMHLRQRDLTTKSGEVGTLGHSESVGLGIRVVVNGAWGFASTDQLTREGVALTETDMQFRKIDSWFASSAGSKIHQRRYHSGCGIVATCFKGDAIQKRSYPNSFGGQHILGGYELIEAMNLLKHAPQMAEEAVSLHSAAQCPEKKTTLILGGSQLGLQIHESVGHPIELDRVLGQEANFAGTSFLTLDKLNNLRYASPIVNVVADAR